MDALALGTGVEGAAEAFEFGYGEGFEVGAGL